MTFTTDDTTIVVIYKSLIMEIMRFFYPSVWTVVPKNLCLKRVCSPSPSPYPIILTRVGTPLPFNMNAHNRGLGALGSRGKLTLTVCPPSTVLLTLNLLA